MCLNIISKITLEGNDKTDEKNPKGILWLDEVACRWRCTECVFTSVVWGFACVLWLPGRACNSNEYQSLSETQPTPSILNANTKTRHPFLPKISPPVHQSWPIQTMRTSKHPSLVQTTTCCTSLCCLGEVRVDSQRETLSRPRCRAFVRGFVVNLVRTSRRNPVFRNSFISKTLWWRRGGENTPG